MRVSRHYPVRNNPISFVDPDGRISDPVLGGIIITGAGAIYLLYEFYQCSRWRNKTEDKAKQIREQLYSSCDPDIGYVEAKDVHNELIKTEEYKKMLEYCTGTAVDSYTSP